MIDSHSVASYKPVAGIHTCEVVSTNAPIRTNTLRSTSIHPFLTEIVVRELSKINKNVHDSNYSTIEGLLVC